MLEKDIERRLKKISIVGRMALGIRCFEIYLEKIGLLKNPLIQNMLSDLWEFTTLNRIDKWDEKIMEYDPDFIAAYIEEDDTSYYKILSSEAVKMYYDIYQSTSHEVANFVDDVIWIGKSNLYSGTRSYSKSTFNLTVKVLTLLRQNGLEIPDLSVFEKSKYEENHGWGKPRERAFFE